MSSKANNTCEEDEERLEVNGVNKNKLIKNFKKRYNLYFTTILFLFCIAFDENDCCLFDGLCPW